jgi:hypothetical protein
MSALPPKAAAAFADRGVRFSDHWYGNQRADTCHVDGGKRYRLAVEVSPARPQIVYLDRLPSFHGADSRYMLACSERRSAHEFDQQPASRGDSKCVTFGQPYGASAGFHVRATPTR